MKGAPPRPPCASGIFSNAIALTSGISAVASLDVMCHHPPDNLFLLGYLDMPTSPPSNMCASPGNNNQPLWSGESPFRGLQRFEQSHAFAFFGRDQAIQQITEIWTRRATSGTAFLMIVGAIGTGKSSLIRAGLLPRLPDIGYSLGVGWYRTAYFWPGKAKENLWAGLAQALLHKDALPELAETGMDAVQLGEQWRSNPELRETIFQTALQKARDNTSGNQQKQGRLIVVVDQMETLFTLPGVTQNDREQWVAFLAFLACSGLCWVIGAMRSDFFHRTAEIAPLRDMMAGDGLYHLSAPSPEEMAQMIQKPAALLGIEFEQDTSSGRKLDELLLEAASNLSVPLPPLAFILLALYRMDVQLGKGNRFTLACYRKLGGVRGAIGQQVELDCERALDKAGVIKTLPAVLRALIALDPVGKMVTARSTRVRRIATTMERTLILKRLVQKGYVVVDGDSKGASARLVHESLFYHWPRLQDVIADELSFLLTRDRLGKESALWLAKKRHPDFALASGWPLEEGKTLLLRRRKDLTPEMVEFIEHSITRHRFMQGPQLREMAHVVRAYEHAEELANFILFNLWDRLRSLGRLDLLDQAALKALAYFEQQTDCSFLTPLQRQRRAEVVISLGDVLITQGNTEKAMVGYRKGIEIFQQLAAEDSQTLERQRPLSVSREKLGNILRAQGDLAGALAEYRSLLKISERLAEWDSTNSDWQRDLWVSYNKVGEVLQDMGDWAGALVHFQAALDISVLLTQKDGKNTGWQRDLSISHNLIGNLLQCQEEWSGALAAHQASRAIREKLCQQNPNNGQWQRDLCVSHIKIGDILQVQDDNMGAVAAYQADLDIRARMVQNDPSNPNWNQGLAISHERMGFMFKMMGQYQESLQHFREEITIVETFYAKFPDQPPFKYDLEVPKQHMNELVNLVREGEIRGEKKKKKGGK